MVCSGWCARLGPRRRYSVTIKTIVRWQHDDRCGVTNRHAGGHAATAEVPPKAAVVLRRTCHKGSLSLVPVDQALLTGCGDCTPSRGYRCAPSTLRMASNGAMLAAISSGSRLRIAPHAAKRQTWRPTVKTAEWIPRQSLASGAVVTKDVGNIIWFTVRSGGKPRCTAMAAFSASAA